MLLIEDELVLNQTLSEASMVMETRSRKRFQQEETTAIVVLQKKKKKLKRHNKNDNNDGEQHSIVSFDNIPRDVVQKIYLFLDSARDVYNLSNSSKNLRSSVTPEIVIQAAVFQGGRVL